VRVVRALPGVLFAAGLSIVFVLLAHVVAAASHVSRANPAVRILGALAGRVALGTRGLFPAIALSDAVAAAAWLLATAAVVVLARRASGGGRAGGRASTKPSRVPPTSKVIFLTVSVITLAETAGFAGTYFLYSRHYVYTDNATVDGDRLDISAPATGAVVDWSINQGCTVRPNEIVGRIRGVGGGGQPERTIRSPGWGTVAVTSVVDGVYVTEGTELATAYDFSKIYVTARIDADDLGEVHPGALADIAVDAFPHTPMRGIVESVQGSTAGNFTIYPPVGTANPSQPQRVDQYVPVRIAFLDTGGERLVPGMNVSVHIRKD